jgi:hypothetical protein
MSDLLEKLASVDALNSWVRSRSFYGPTVSPRKRIYEAKKMALKDAVRLLDCDHKLITIMAKCRDCGGTGKYCDGWSEFDHCYRCFNKGMVRLEFVESSIAGRFRWHTPRSESYSFAPPQMGEISFAATDWDVNKDGKYLTPDEAAKHLLVIDQAWPPSRYGDCGTRYCECTGHYHLYAGAVDKVCSHCGSQDVSERCHKTRGRVEFTFGICAWCRKTLTTDEQWNVSLPLELIQPENLMAWVNANAALIERRVA